MRTKTASIEPQFTIISGKIASFPVLLEKISKRRDASGTEPIHKSITQARQTDTPQNLSPGATRRISPISYTWRKGALERKRGIFIQGKGRMVAEFTS